jgi:hypothetical protein
MRLAKDRIIRVKVEDIPQPERTVKVMIKSHQISLDVPAYVVKKPSKRPRSRRPRGRRS